MKRTNWTVSLLSLIFTTTIGTTIGLCQPLKAQTVLYDSTKKQLPDQQRWFSKIPAGATEELQSGVTKLDTSGNTTLQAGYVRVSPLNLPKLDRLQGYTVRADLQLLAETHLSPDRAGLNLILVSSDKRAIELDFWTNQIWAQTDAQDGQIFKHGETAIFATNPQITRYDIVVKGEKYCLFANNNLAAPILKGRMRDYSGFGTPYNMANFMFVGDNSKSASATSRIARIELTLSPIATCN